ncbi:MAG TPA: helix-turn-helix domain-containing protein [Acidimicrobiales bacterium]|nr:helix-turn-helix domain-containing protein [Acidimicrobiales bacterium]
MPTRARAPKQAVRTISDPVELQALAHPLRVRILDELREPDSAAAVGRRLGEARQKVNYHLKELERSGLVVRTGERRNGNFVESLYRASARTLVVLPRAAWGDPRRLEAMADQLSLENLVNVGERLARDAAVLLDRAAFDGAEIASAAVEADLQFASEAERAAFLDEYLAAIGGLVKRYGSKTGAPYRVAVAVYPNPLEGKS